MAITAADLRGYVSATEADDAFLDKCVAEAVALVEAYVADVEVPEAIEDRAVLEVGSELYHRRQAPNGVAQFGLELGSAPVRIARDPMVGAYPLLSPFMGPGIG